MTDLVKELGRWFALLAKTFFISMLAAFTIMITMNGQFPSMSYIDFWQFTWAGLVIVDAGIGVYRAGQVFRRE